MSDELSPRELELLAAEAALGLLSEPEMAAVEALAREDPAFRDTCAGWIARFTTLFDDVRTERPAAAAADRMKSRLLGAPGRQGDRFVTVVLNEEADEAAQEEDWNAQEARPSIALDSLTDTSRRGMLRGRGLGLLPWVGVGLMAAAGVLWMMDLLVAA